MKIRFAIDWFFPLSIRMALWISFVLFFFHFALGANHVACLRWQQLFLQSCIQITLTRKWLFSRFIIFFVPGFFSPTRWHSRSCCLLLIFRADDLILTLHEQKRLLEWENCVRYSGEWCCTFKRTWNEQKQCREKNGAKRRRKIHFFYSSAIANSARLGEKKHRQKLWWKMIFVFDKFHRYTESHVRFSAFIDHNSETVLSKGLAMNQRKK